MKKHERLSEALCEAVEFGRPTAIRMGYDDYDALLASLDRNFIQKIDLATTSFETVSVQRDRTLTGCYVEHDNRYTWPSLADVSAIADTVVRMNDTRKPAIKAW